MGIPQAPPQKLTEAQVRELFRSQVAEDQVERPEFGLPEERDVRQLYRRLELEDITGREPTIEGEIPPIAAPIEARPPAAPTPEAPPARERRPLDPDARQEAIRRLRDPSAFLASQGRQPDFPRAQDFAATLKDVARRIGDMLGQPQRDVMGQPLTRERVAGPPTGVTEPDVLGYVDPMAGATPEMIAAMEPPTPPEALDVSERVPTSVQAVMDQLRSQQADLTRMGLPARFKWAIGSGGIRVLEMFRHPLDPEQRDLTNALENIQTGGGLIPPIDEHRNFVTHFGLGLAEMVPELVLLQATGVFGLTGRLTLGARAKVIAALEKRFGNRAAVRIFEEALEESVEEGLSIAAFESVIGRGAGMSATGRLTVFGSELLSETGGLVFGGGIGAGRQIWRELARLKGPISREIWEQGVQNPMQIGQMLDDIAIRRDVPIEQVWDEFGQETNQRILDAVLRLARRPSEEIGTMAEIRGIRTEAAEQASREAMLAEPRALAQQLADDPTAGQNTALRAIVQRYPRLSDEDAATVVAEAFGRAPVREQMVDVEGRPIPEEPTVSPEERGEGVPLEMPRGQVRAQISQRLATLEVTANRQIESLRDPDVDAPVAMGTLDEVLAELDEIVNVAASAGENAMVDRAARLSATVQDAIQFPPERVAARPAEAPGAPEAPEVAPTPERPVAAAEPAAKPTEPPAPEPTPAPAQPTPERLPAAERLDPEQRAQIEETFPEARDLTDEELAEELAGLGIEPQMLAERPTGRRLEDLSDEELIGRIRAAGKEIPAAGPDFRERLLDAVEPERAVAEERRALRGRLAEEIRGRRAAEREALTDARTGLGNQRAFDLAKPRAEADAGTSFIEIDVRNLSVANNEVSQELGDQLIAEAGAAVRQAAGEAGVSDRQMFRSGGDEFTIIAPNEVAEQIRARAVELMPERPIEGTEFTTGLRGGVGATAADAGQAIAAAKKAETGRAKAPPPEEPPAAAAEPARPPPKRPEPPEAERPPELEEEEVVVDPDDPVAAIGYVADAAVFEFEGMTAIRADGSEVPMKQLLDEEFAEDVLGDPDNIEAILAGRLQEFDEVQLPELMGGERVPLTEAITQDLSPAMNEIIDDLQGRRVVFNELTGEYSVLEQAIEELEPAVSRREGPKYEEIVEEGDLTVDAFEPGDTDQLLVERPDGRTDRLAVQYSVVEADELRQSHEVRGGKAERNPDYPSEVQTRDRFDPEFVAERATEGVFDEGQLVLKSPTAERGAPIVTTEGVVLGGNNRVAIIKNVYDDAGAAADRYRNAIVERAEEFGLTPDQVGDFSNPVLVRRLEDTPRTTKDARQLADDLNRTAVRARTSAEEATLASERLTDETLAWFDEHLPEDATLRAFLNTAEGVAFVKRLRDEGVITADQSNRFFDKQGVLTPEGRDFVENVILGRAVGSAEVIEQMPAYVRNKLVKAAPVIAGLKGKFAIQPAVQEAARLLGEAQRAGMAIRDYLGQATLEGFEGPPRSGPGKQMAMFLGETPTQKLVVAGFRRFRSASDAAPLGQAELLPGAKESPRAAFIAAFGDDVLGAAVEGAEFAATLPKPEPVTPPAAPRLKLTPEAQAKLREKMGVEITPQQQLQNLEAFRRRSDVRAQRAAEREAKRGKAERAPVQPRGAGKRPTKPITPERQPGPGESGGGRVTGKDPVDVNPPKEPDVARGQRRREAEKLKREQKAEARRKALEEERKRLDDAAADADDVTDIRKVRESIRAGLRAAAKAANVDAQLVDDQLKDIARIQSNLLDAEVTPDAPRPGFLVGNSPGTGKTFVGAAAVREVIERAAQEGRKARVLVVIPGKAAGPVVAQWSQVARDVFDFEMKPFKPGETPIDESGVFTMSATGLGNQFDARRGLKNDFGNFDLVVFDESHLFANVFGANRAFAARTVRRNNADRTLHLSATPFEFPWDMAYLENLRLWGRGRKYANFEQWLTAHGIRKAKRTKNTWYFVKSNRADVLRTLTQIRREMIEAGIYTQREIRVDKKLRNEFVEVKMDNVYGSYYNDVMTELANLEATATGVEVNLLRSARVTFTRRISELAKIPEAIKLAKQWRKQGRSVVIFTAYKMDFELAPKTAKRFPSLARVVETVNEQMREGLNRIVRELGGEDAVAQVHGGISSAKRRKADIEDYNSGKKKFMVATVDAGGTGLSLHDLTGKHPRVQINLTTPWTGKAAEQLAGRSYRVGSQSDVIMVWMGIDTPVERQLLQRVATKWQAMGALVQGKVDTDAVKLAEFDFLPAAEIQQHLFGYKQNLGVDPAETSLDFQGSPNRQRPSQSESMARLDKATDAFKNGASWYESTKPQGAHATATNPTQPGMSADLDLPRPNVKIVKPSKIIGTAMRQMVVRAFLGGIKQFNVKGRFKIVADLIRLRSAQNVRTAAHEIGHHVDLQDFGFIQHPRDIGHVVPTHLMPFVDELRPMAYDGAKDPVTEGFAEFVAEYVMRPKYAAEKAPKFFEYFRNHMNTNNPMNLATLDWMQQQVSLLKRLPEAEQVGSRMIIGDSGEIDYFQIMPGKRFKKWYVHWLNYQKVFKEMDQMMMLDDPNWRSLEMLARRTYGADPLAENMMIRGVMDFIELDKNNKVKRVSKGLPEIFSKIDKREDFDLFRYWAAARRAVELKKRGLETGMEDLYEDGTLQSLIDKVEGSELADVFNETWDELDLYQTALLKWLVDSQNLSPEQALAMKKMNDYYVPFHRLMDEPDQMMDWVAAAKGAKAGQNVDGVVGLPPAIYAFKGSTRPIVDPIESIVGNTRFFTQLGFRKQVENALAKFSNDTFGADGHGKFITRIDPKIVASQFTVQQVKEALENLGIRLEDVTDEQLGEILTLFAPAKFRKDVPVFNAVIDGKRQWFQVNDPDTWNALAGLNHVEFSWLANVAITAKTALRNGVVMSPEFMVRNFLRDAQTAWIQTPARGKGARGVGRKIPMVAAVEGLAESIGRSDLWDEFVASGAAGANLARISRRSNQRYMREMFGRKGISKHLALSHGVVWNVREAFRMVRDASLGFMYRMQGASSIFENANRLSTFRAAREEGADMLSAGFAGREVSTDFAVHGSKMAFWRLATAFLNPAAQGMTRTARAFTPRTSPADAASRSNPIKTLARSSMLTFSSAALWYYNQRTNEDWPEYSANLKSRYWIVKDPWSGTVWRAPKTYVYGDVFGSLMAEAFLDYAFDKDPDIMRRLGSVLQQGFGLTMLPTLALAPLEIALNRSLYFNTPIESMSMMEQLPKEMRSRVYTSEASRLLSEALARFAETADTRGLGRIGRFINRMNLSPVQFDHVVRGYFGTLGYDAWAEIPFLMRGGKNLWRRIAGDEPIPQPVNNRLRNHVFLRGFTIQFPSASAESIRRFYDRRELVTEIAVRYEHLQNVADAADEDTEAVLRAARYFENHMQEILTAPLIEQMASQLATLARDKANSTSNEEIDAINREALTLAQDALRALGEMTPAENKIMENRLREVRFQRTENKQLNLARNQIELLVFRRQVRGVTQPEEDERAAVRAIINGITGITGSQRASLSRYYRSIRVGSMVEREASKTQPAVKRRFRQQERQKP
ncbi:MAG: diguanylate cyclase [bacterium]|nr:diguanylate cyclase [bacterium]